MPTSPQTHRPRNAARQKVSRRGYGGGWRRLRLLILAGEPLCRQCGRAATDVDHIVPRRDGGPDSAGNLQALCHRCHSSKTRSGR